ncbi:MAG: TIGR00730 family Rossman fold protein [Chloroflexi bacterium]|nr:TIGR00730 family Rossman fold protein [Chloroflexota bacterium]
MTTGPELPAFSDARGPGGPDAAASIPLVHAVAVFGSSRAAEGSHTYREAYALGRALAGAGLVVVNGGYCGVMAAVARGAKEAGGRTLGITVALFPGRVPNPWLDEVVHAPTLFARLEEFTCRADAFVALCGGIGTLLELSLVWNLSQTGALGNKPVVLLGQHWTPLLRALRRHTSISDEDLALFRRAHTATDVVRLLRGPSAAGGGGRDTPSPGGAG